MVVVRRGVEGGSGTGGARGGGTTSNLSDGHSTAKIDQWPISTLKKALSSFPVHTLDRFFDEQRKKNKKQKTPKILCVSW